MRGSAAAGRWRTRRAGRGGADARAGVSVPRPGAPLPAAHHARAGGRAGAPAPTAHCPALLSTVPAVVLFGVWGAGRLLAPAEVEEGAPWKAWGPLLSPSAIWPSSHSGRTWTSSRRCSRTSSGTAATAGASGRSWRSRSWPSCSGSPVGDRLRARARLERWRLPGLALLAGALFLLLPFDIRGAVYYLNTRYAHLAAPLAVAALPPLAARVRPVALSSPGASRRSRWPFRSGAASVPSTSRRRRCSALPRRRRPGLASWG